MDQPDNLDAQHADTEALQRMGEMVCERLAGDARAYAVPADGIELFAVGDFLSAGECAELIERIDAVAQPSKVFDLDYAAGYRTSYSGDFDPHDPLVAAISKRIDDLLGMQAEWGETIQGQRYEPGQQFQPHHDFFHPGTSYWDAEMARGGQRSFTAMVYLNAPEEGGATEFTELGIALDPEPGVLVVWNNANRDGTPNPRTIHAGRPVVRGTKYVITKWYRTRMWG